MAVKKKYKKGDLSKIFGISLLGIYCATVGCRAAPVTTIPESLGKCAIVACSDVASVVMLPATVWTFGVKMMVGNKYN